LARCEAELQRIAAEAMAQGDYAGARSGLELAEQVGGLNKGLGVPEAAATKPRPATAAKPKPPATPRKTAKKAAKTTAKRPAPEKAYPRFAREGDKLIKIGWSKRTKQEYNHKAPRAAVEAFVAHLRKHTKDERLFTIDDVTPIPDPENDGDLPGYQVYMAIAWLRSLGVLFKHGRSDYSVGHAAIKDKPLAQAWKHLPSHII
jgi:hypothetical protein